MSSSPREIGTLIVVILKANHLPNKRHIGKQDPYCLVAVNGEKQRTKVVKRGGQHPEWDEEIRFTLYEDHGVVSSGQDGPPPPPPPKDGKKNIKGGSVMKLSCFADDPREPDLIGQADVDLTEVLTKGETDGRSEWFTLMNKDKFAGKVYLELTFWSNEPPPEKKVAPQAPKGSEYSGPGSFISSDDVRSVPGSGFPSSRVASTSSVYPHSRQQSDSVPSSLRSSHSLAQLDLYRPPYEQEHRSRGTSFSALTNDFGELGIGDPGRRRESFPVSILRSPLDSAEGPPLSTMHGARPPSSAGFSTYPPAHGYEHSVSDVTSMYAYERPLTPPGQSHDSSSFARPAPYTPQAPYRPQYDSGSVAYHPPPSRGPRYSMPAAPSGFRPLSNSSSFTPLPSHPSDPSGFAPPLSHTPAPNGYSPPHINPPTSYAPAASQTPGPGYPLPPTPFPQQGFPPSQSFQYSQFQPQPPPQQYNTPPQTHMQTPTPPGYLPPSPTNQSPAPSLSHSNSLSSSAGPGSRPLPQQPQFHASQGSQSYGLPPSSSQPPHPGSYSPTHPGNSTFPDNYQPAPPLPPPPHQTSLPPPLHQTYFASDSQGSTNPQYQSPPLPPAPPAHPNASSPRRHSSLPPPPTHLQQPYPPPPPPPPLEYSPHNPPPPPPPLPLHGASQPQPYYPGPPPRPPVQIDGQTQWSQPQPPQNSYVHQAWS
ncbi:hypothetical protein B0H17DRAFT_925810 [Mycena rosella]|uniref:C2 domain-containing protein n=1 Tax=Mycena rosella TaxID=1033263 RepID=A0AAD7DWC9_MYCRO|nr:hypothetical protein B0H17DRAFT_925810 [Mycena rosella]